MASEQLEEVSVDTTINNGWWENTPRLFPLQVISVEGARMV